MLCAAVQKALNYLRCQETLIFGLVYDAETVKCLLFSYSDIQNIYRHAKYKNAIYVSKAGLSSNK